MPCSVSIGRPSLAADKGVALPFTTTELGGEANETVRTFEEDQDERLRDREDAKRPHRFEHAAESLMVHCGRVSVYVGYTVTLVVIYAVVTIGVGRMTGLNAACASSSVSKRGNPSQSTV